MTGLRLLTHSNTQAMARKGFLSCRSFVLGVFLIGGMAVAPLSASAQSNDTANRIKRLENEIDTLSRAVYKGETPPASVVPGGASGDAAAALNTRVDQMESDLRNLTGKIEQQTHDTQQLQQKLDALTQEMQMRMGTMESRGAMAAQPQTPPVSASGTDAAQVPPEQQTDGSMPPAPSPAGSGALQPGDMQPAPVSGAQPAAGGAVADTTKPLGGGSVVTPSGTPAASDAATLYEQGYAEIKKADYATAEKTFAGFIKQYPNHALTPNAYYWLGETYYARKDYNKASRTFAESYKKFPKGPKAADNLLKLGLSLAGKGQKDNACVALGQLKKEYPKGAPDVLAKGDAEMKNLGCK